MSSFRSELISWKSVFLQKKATLLFGSFLIVISMMVYGLLASQYRAFSDQIQSMTAEGELIVEMDQNLGEEGIKEIETEIRAFPMVSKIEYWSLDRIEAYIDHLVLPGYKDFLKKTGAEVPVKPMLRISITDLSERAELEKLLSEKYGHLLSFSSGLVSEQGQAYATTFIAQIERSLTVYRALKIFQMLLILGLSAALLFDLIAERKRRFHAHC